MQAFRTALAKKPKIDQGQLRSLALDVLNDLATKNGEAAAIDTALVVRAAYCGPADRAFRRLQGALERGAVSTDHLVDTLIPEATTVIGTSWHEGEIDTLEATIAFARLQTLLHDLPCDPVAGPRRCHGSVLIVLPSGEQHSLGPLLAAHQLRRRGFTTDFEFLLQDREDAPENLRDLRRYDAVFLSVSSGESLPSCARLVAQLKETDPPLPKLVLGGAVLTTTARDFTDLRQEIGVDAVARSVEEAIEFCGLSAES